jgi:propanol-preferring alcohol dehydrogenase
MRAMVLKQISPVEAKPLELEELPVPEPAPEQILVRVSACGVCHTELDEIEGRRKPKLPVILGHEVVGRVEKLGSHANKFKLEERVGIAWIYSACGKCSFCREGNENLCD